MLAPALIRRLLERFARPSTSPSAVAASEVSAREGEVARLVARGLSNAEIAAALYLSEATVKTFQRKDGHVWLLPHNDAYDPIPGDNATILGVVTAVLRSL